MIDPQKALRRVLFFIVPVVIIVSLVLLRHSVDCGSGEPLTWFSDSSGTREDEQREMQSTIDAVPSYRTLRVSHVRGHLVTINFQRDVPPSYGKYMFLPTALNSNEFRDLWRNIYIAHHLNAHRDVSTTVQFDIGAASFTLFSGNCALS